ncbi:MAG: DUF192 domain-containing protein [Bryobacterales bacterium]|nr:DUF192 domain-containing protein [Bryobacterales bacterium]
MQLRLFLLAVLVAALSGCSKQTSNPDEINLRTVILPGGHRVYAEVLFRRDDMARGMMFRKSLAEDRALLFIHPKSGRYAYWMHNVQVPLDILWMDKERRIVEIHANTPPCLEQDPVRCPQYGGKADSQFVLELGGGQAAKLGLREGQTIQF